MAEEQPQPPSTITNNHHHSDLILSFIEITSSSIEEATFFLESHSFDLDSALSTFFETTTAVHQNPNSQQNDANDDVNSPASSSRSRSRSVSPPPSFEAAAATAGGGGGVYNLRSRNTDTGSGRTGRIRTFADLNKKECEDCDSGSDDEDDKPQEYYTGGQRSGQLVQDPSKRNDVESLFEQARRAGAEDGTLDQHQPSSSSRSFSGRGRLLSGETPSAAPQQQPEPEVHTITFWTNGFTVNDGPLRRLDDPQNASFLESIRNSECPEELTPAKGRAPVHVSLVRKMEDYPIKKQRQAAFAGIGRTLGSTTSAEDTTATIPAPTFAPPTPFVGLVVDDTLPSTSIQLRLGDGTRMVSRFNLHHTLNDLNETIQEAGRSLGFDEQGYKRSSIGDKQRSIEVTGYNKLFVKLLLFELVVTTAWARFYCQRVLVLETTKANQALEIRSLKRRVKKLKKKVSKKTYKLKRLYKIGSSTRVESSEDAGLGDQEDASKQERIIDDLDADEGVTLVDETQGRNDQDMFDISILDDEEVLAKKKVSTADPVTTAGEVVTTVGVTPLFVKKTLCHNLGVLSKHS
nr:hypothetical protein [Tanacetum cinerariifolium]